MHVLVFNAQCNAFGRCTSLKGDRRDFVRDRHNV